MKKDIIITDKKVNKFKAYLIEQERSANTIRNYISEVKSLQFYLDDEPITKNKLLEYKAMLSSKYAPSTTNVTIAAINSFTKYLGRMDLQIKPLKIQKNLFATTDRELSKSDYEKLIRAAEINGDDRLSLAI